MVCVYIVARGNVGLQGLITAKFDPQWTFPICGHVDRHEIIPFVFRLMQLVMWMKCLKKFVKCLTS